MELGHAQEHVTRLAVLFLLVEGYAFVQVRNVGLGPWSRRLRVLQRGKKKDGNQSWQAKFHAGTFSDSAYFKVKTAAIQNSVSLGAGFMWRPTGAEPKVRGSGFT